MLLSVIPVCVSLCAFLYEWVCEFVWVVVGRNYSEIIHSVSARFHHSWVHTKYEKDRWCEKNSEKEDQRRWVEEKMVQKYKNTRIKSYKVDSVKYWSPFSSFSHESSIFIPIPFLHVAVFGTVKFRHCVSFAVCMFVPEPEFVVLKYLFLCLSVCLFLCVCVSWSVCDCLRECESLCLRVYFCLCVCERELVSLSQCGCEFKFVCLTLCLSLCLFVCVNFMEFVSVYVFVCLCLFVCFLCVSLSVWVCFLFVWVFTSLCE